MRERGRGKIRALPHMQALFSLHHSGFLPARGSRGDTDDDDDDPLAAGRNPPRRRERWAREETMPAEKKPAWAIAAPTVTLEPRPKQDLAFLLVPPVFPVSPVCRSLPPFARGLRIHRDSSPRPLVLQPLGDISPQLKRHLTRPSCGTLPRQPPSLIGAYRITLLHCSTPPTCPHCPHALPKAAVSALGCARLPTSLVVVDVPTTSLSRASRIPPRDPSSAPGSQFSSKPYVIIVALDDANAGMPVLPNRPRPRASGQEPLVRIRWRASERAAIKSSETCRSCAVRSLC